MNNQIKPQNEACLTSRQAAEILNVSLSTLKKLIYSGKIKTFTTPGGHHRITKDSLLNFEATENPSYSLEGNAEILLPETTESFIKIMESRLKFGENHSSNTAKLSAAIAQSMGFSPQRLQNIKLAALLHDIGKFNIDTNILDKPAFLSANEYKIIKCHPSIGFDILNSIKPFKHLAAIVRQHHEKYDGSGYPDNLKNKEIYIEARIICLADSFDAMTSLNSYKKPLSLNLALEEVERNIGAHFDPEVCAKFLNLAKDKNSGVIN